MEGLFSKFQKRVSFGVKSEIVGLTEIPFVKAARARALFKAGLRSVQAIAEATLPESVKALYGNISWAGPGDKNYRGQQWFQMGIALKVKNGARRVALDRAEEARAAAFSAYEALGVQVPAALALPIVGTLHDEEEAQLAPAMSFNSMMEALSVGAELKTAKVPTASETKTQFATEIDEESDMLLQKLESIPSFRDQKPTSSVPAPDEIMSGKTADNRIQLQA